MDREALIIALAVILMASITFNVWAHTRPPSLAEDRRREARVREARVRRAVADAEEFCANIVRKPVGQKLLNDLDWLVGEFESLSHLKYSQFACGDPEDEEIYENIARANSIQDAIRAALGATKASPPNTKE